MKNQVYILHSKGGQLKKYSHDLFFNVFTSRNHYVDSEIDGDWKRNHFAINRSEFSKHDLLSEYKFNKKYIMHFAFIKNRIENFCANLFSCETNNKNQHIKENESDVSLW